MYGINMPDNEWYYGYHYAYNEDYDQTRKEIKRLITASEFVEDSDYDTEGYFTIPTKVRYKQYEDRAERFNINAGFVNRKKRNQIEITNSTVIFKEKDRFKLANQDDEEKGRIITAIDYNRNTNKSMATLLLPGLYDEYNSRTILTLE